MLELRYHITWWGSHLQQTPRLCLPQSFQLFAYSSFAVSRLHTQHRYMDSDAKPNSIPQLVIPDFVTKGTATRALNDIRPRKDAAIEACAICLESITVRAVAVPCNHLTFDFLCLASWLQERATCPLCKAAVTEVQYDWHDADNYKTYHVPKPKPSEDGPLAARATYLHSRNFARRSVGRARIPSEDPALEKRRHIYRHRLFSQHVGSNDFSQYRDFTHEVFAASTDLQSRARTFLRRELQVFSFLDSASAPRARNRSFLVEYIVVVLKVNELKGSDGHAEDLLAEFLGKDNTRLVLHELEAWLRSPHRRVEEWDVEVQYTGTSRVAKATEAE